MQDKTHYTNGQFVFRQDGAMLTYYFKTGLKKAEGRSVDGVMQGEWRFWRETGELWQVGHFRDGLKHGPWVRHARNGIIEKVKILDSGRRMKAQVR